jgi:arylsulfatase A-like enzyme
MHPRLRSVVALAIAAWLTTWHAGTAGVHVAGGAVLAQGAAGARPDVILVLTDQQRADAFGAAGAEDLRTPVMDRLASEGVRFTHAFAATPQCSPSRAALLTSLYPHRTGVMGNTAAGPAGSQAPTAASTSVMSR